RAAVLDLGSAFDGAIDRMLQIPTSQANDLDAWIPRDPLQDLIMNRLMISKYLNQDLTENEAISNSLRHVDATGKPLRYISIADAIAAKVGYTNFTYDRLLQLAKNYIGRELNAPQFVGRIYESNPSGFRSFFLVHLENIAEGKKRNEVSKNFNYLIYAVQPPQKKSIWHSIVQRLLADSESRVRVKAALEGIKQLVMDDKDEQQRLVAITAIQSLSDMP
ncbi:MAG: hypothetical protein ABL921_28320, partial [Pirellula sp.]